MLSNSLSYEGNHNQVVLWSLRRQLEVKKKKRKHLVSPWDHFSSTESEKQSAYFSTESLSFSSTSDKNDYIFFFQILFWIETYTIISSCFPNDWEIKPDAFSWTKARMLCYLFHAAFV